MTFYKISAYRFFWLTVALVVGWDRASKLWVLSKIPAQTYWAPIPVIDGFLYWVHVYNTGAAWSLFTGHGWWLVFLGAVALVGIFFGRYQLALKNPAQQGIFGLLVGGIIGNMWDRIQYGHVVDFIDVHLPFYRWPAFNIADIAIVAGVGLYFIAQLRRP